MPEDIFAVDLQVPDSEPVSHLLWDVLVRGVNERPHLSEYLVVKDVPGEQ